jgi:5-methylcytosine-specific restriction protein A
MGGDRRRARRRAELAIAERQSAGETRRMTDRRSVAASEYRKWYSSAAWRQLRAAQLEVSPWCLFCQRMRRRIRATQVDHRVPHRGDAFRFFDPTNLVSLCKPHHDATKKRIESGRTVVAVGPDGWPLPPPPE